MLHDAFGERSQNLHTRSSTALVVGMRVRARGGIWRIHQIQSYESCRAVHLAGIERSNAGERRILLEPFDRLQPHITPVPLRAVRKPRWCRALRTLLTSDHPWHGLRTAAASRVELFPFQLEPALAMVRGMACRVLLADEVGLGKTIQAGLIIAELRHRGRADRVLILTPSGLRRQWQNELKERFSLQAAVVDSALLRRWACSLPTGTNPWLADDLIIASIDLVKRPEAIRGLDKVAWDLVLIDEAHVAAEATLRRQAADMIASRAADVVLITATPHAGDPRAFEALCSIGGADGSPLAMFRRTRSDAGFSSVRRVRTMAINLGTAELLLHERLRAYAHRVLRETEHDRRDGLLAIAVLTKRALSCPRALAISVERRLQVLALNDSSQIQLPLPLADDSNEDEEDRDLEPFGILAAPGLADRTGELGCLAEIATIARDVGRGRKLAVLVRLVSRLREPVLIFTEYRDTLEHVRDTLAPIVSVAVIHGGLTEADRLRAQAEFTCGAARVLLATDAAGEGLNLQARCRVVINLELPWNPMRLEQRIGRVDRLGQVRTVHVINLFASQTAEATVLAKLVRRLDQAQRSVGHLNDPLGAIAHDEIAAALIDATGRVEEPTSSAIEIPTDSIDPAAAGNPAIWRPDLRDDGLAEAERLKVLRRWIERGTFIDHSVTSVTILPARRLGWTSSAPTLVWVIRVHLLDGNGQLIEQVIVPVRGRTTLAAPLHSPRQVRTFFQEILSAVQPSLFAVASDVAQRRLLEIEAAGGAAPGAACARAQYLMRRIEGEGASASLFQLGLFDRRATRNLEAHLQHRSHLLANAVARARHLEISGRHPVASDPELVLALGVWNQIPEHDAV